LSLTGPLLRRKSVESDYSIWREEHREMFLKAMRHFKTITRHKWYVMIECFKLGLYWQGIVHDLSKYGPAEFWASAKYFQGDKNALDVGEYSIAWLNHKAKNKHHWEYWIDFVDGDMVAVPIPEKYLKEMFCDLIGASKAYSQNRFDRGEPLEYFLAHSDKWFIDERSKNYLQKLLEACAEGR
jgi:hypothetical protein